MLLARFGTVLLLVAAVGIAKPPSDSSTICDRFQSSDVIFTGSAVGPWVSVFQSGKSPIHKRSEKSKRVRFLVREWYKGQRQDFVDVWMTPSECPLKIEANEMYVIYAHINKEEGKANGRMESNACMGTALATNAADDLGYLNASLQGSGRATRISGTTAANANVEAKSGIDIRYAIADGAGKFTFNGLRPGDWKLAIAGGTPQQVQVAPNSCVMEELH